MDGIAYRVAFRYRLADDDDDDDEDLFDDFVQEVYEGGKKKVPNPNPATKDQYPQVSFSTAIATPAFWKRVQDEFTRWKAKTSEKDTGGTASGASDSSVGITERDVDAVLTAHRESFKRITTSMRAKVAAYRKKPSKSVMPLEVFDRMSEAEQMLFVAGHEVGDYFQSKVAKHKAEHAHLMKRWRMASGDSEVQALHGLLSSLGVPGSFPEGEHEDKGLAKAYKAGAGDKKLLATVREAVIFERAFFKHLGVKELTVYRDIDGQGLDGKPKGQEVQVGCRPASSFSFDPTIAGTFGKHTVSFKVPVESVLASPLTNPDFGSALAEREGGATGESEIIVMGASTLRGRLLR